MLTRILETRGNQSHSTPRSVHFELTRAGLLSRPACSRQGRNLSSSNPGRTEGSEEEERRGGGGNREVEVLAEGTKANRPLQAAFSSRKESTALYTHIAHAALNLQKGHRNVRKYRLSWRDELPRASFFTGDPSLLSPARCVKLFPSYFRSSI